jgi:hypothetical protein
VLDECRNVRKIRRLEDCREQIVHFEPLTYDLLDVDVGGQSQGGAHVIRNDAGDTHQPWFRVLQRASELGRGERERRRD